ncbi:hypothetical protein DFR72_10868 [Lentzea flaviverrucosa]|uniref:Uncharacterized protein n=1 Tax=Lentzea flaviverrucosa TaxID=200379 RepID=A0A1H9SJQ2_9PSEU|nr:hypothetical protein DFR72_10868 [Lentzea flaviverrucosa]SER84479.1 hypothetical protein SAMN05216195_10769 [Lentzea flaviverrucosa]
MSVLKVLRLAMEEMGMQPCATSCIDGEPNC